MAAAQRSTVRSSNIITLGTLRQLVRSPQVSQKRYCLKHIPCGVLRVQNMTRRRYVTVLLKQIVCSVKMNVVRVQVKPISEAACIQGAGGSGKDGISIVRGHFCGWDLSLG